MLEEQRQVVLDAAGRQAVANLAVDQAAPRIAAEPGPIALAEAGDALARERKLARRQQFDALDPLPGKLAVRVEGPDRLDLVVEQVDPVGLLAAAGKEVDQRAAHGELPVLGDLRHRAVAGRLQTQPETFPVEAFAGAQHQGVAVEVFARGQAL